MINTDVIVVLLAITTVATAVVFGLGFLPYPSREGAIFSSAFTGAMVSSYLWLAAVQTDADALRGAAAAAMFGAGSLFWVGLRQRRRAHRTHVMTVLVLFSIAAIALTATSTSDWYALTFHASLLMSGVFSALTAVELVRLGRVYRDEALPLIIASIMVTAVAVLASANAVLMVTGDGDASPLATVAASRAVNAMGAAVYIVCALITLVLLMRETKTEATEQPSPFEVVARQRLERAERAGDEWWSLLDVRLDDPDDLREGSSTSSFTRVVQRLDLGLHDMLPADADIERVSDTHYVVLLARPDASTRPLLTRLLTQINEFTDARADELRFSASIGWAPVADVGYRLDDLRLAAAEAAGQARTDGGNRWARAMPILVDDGAGAAASS